MRSFLEANPEGFADRKFSEASHIPKFGEVSPTAKGRREALTNEGEPERIQQNSSTERK